MMKSLLATAATLFVISTLTYAAAPSADQAVGFKAKSDAGVTIEAKRRKARVPGGSGCDSAHDIAEHPECRRADLTTTPDLIQEAKRSKPRVPGGSGCDTAQDVAEHPECRA